MADITINDLYLKYVNKVGSALERDRYFQYLFEMVQAGNNELQQKYQVMHKVVDERWLGTIEESLDAINTIIEKPRRFVTTKEEVVPVALAKKITADSVRHLSMNTQFIASSEEGDIQPTKVLNISTEESYDLYENRFVYHLIQRLVTFIDKRTDVIFWQTGDETQNTLSYKSKVDDAYEEIEYKIEMTIKNRQSFAENDADNMNVFMRIDRVRRMVMALKNSAFCSLMSGCAKVRSPIQRTNLIMKDPQYRTCYKLWQFLESYDEVGYTIDVQDSVLEFDEEYLIQMYINMITNYTVFKSLTESDKRKIDAPLAKKRRAIKPKFIKKIKEEIVDDYNIEDVEVRQVIIEEVTQAQLDAEAKLEEETKLRIEAQQALDDMDSQVIYYQQQVSNLMMMNQEAEVQAEAERQAKEEALALAEQEKTAREAAEQNAQAELAAAKEREEQAAEEIRSLQQKGQEAREAAQRILEETKEEAQRQIEEAKEEAENLTRLASEEARRQITQAKEEASRQITEMQAEAEKQITASSQKEQEALQQASQYRQQMKEAKEYAQREVSQAQEKLEEARHEAELQIVAAKERIEQAQINAEKQTAQIRAEAEAQVQKQQEEAKQDIARVKADAELRIEEVQTQADARIAENREQAEAETQKIRADADSRIEEVKLQAQEDIRKAKEEADRLAQEKIAQAKAEADRRIEEMKQQLLAAQKKTEEAEESARLAQEKADANTLSRYIASSFNNRKNRRGGDK